MALGPLKKSCGNYVASLAQNFSCADEYRNEDCIIENQSDLTNLSAKFDGSVFTGGYCEKANGGSFPLELDGMKIAQVCEVNPDNKFLGFKFFSKLLIFWGDFKFPVRSRVTPRLNLLKNL